MHDYLPIAEHGIIGDLHTIALIGSDGTIDWYCCPTFDSPSVFASILDKERGGYYRITPARAGWTTKQLYFPDTNVLITRFFSSEGVGELQGFMPIARTGEELHRHRLIRRVVAVRGEMRFRLDLQPRFNYGRDPHRTEQYEHGVVFEAPEISLALQTTTRRSSRWRCSPGCASIGMKSCTSPTPSHVKKRVMRTFVSGK